MLESTLQRDASGDEPDTLKRELQQLRSGVAAALGTLPVASISSDTRDALADVLRELYTAAPDGGTHSAAAWALRQWKRELPVIEPTPTPHPQPLSPQAGRGETKNPLSPSAGRGAGVRGWFVNRLGMTMLEVPPGKFTRNDDEPDAKPHEVTITRPFYLCDREVSLDLFTQFANDPDYPAAEKPKDWKLEDYTKQFSPTGDCPVQSVVWFDAVLFCNWLSWKEGRQACYQRTGEKMKFNGDREEEWDVWNCDFGRDGYRLATEAEWEYACRAAATTRFAFGDDESLLVRFGYHVNNSKSQAWPGGNLLPNAFGLFDMHGNVWEWCNDWYGAYDTTAFDDPRGPGTGSSRVLRGGSWGNPAWHCRSAARGRNAPSYRTNSLGFRVAASPCGK